MRSPSPVLPTRLLRGHESSTLRESNAASGADRKIRRGVATSRRARDRVDGVRGHSALEKVDVHQVKRLAQDQPVSVFESLELNLCGVAAGVSARDSAMASGPRARKLEAPHDPALSHALA
eukprot:843675-Rhodomonas_salina.2